MRVDFTNLGMEPPDNRKAAGQSQAGGANLAGAAANLDAQPGLDRAQFSFDPARVVSLSAQALAAPEVRSARVDPLQQAVSAGNYTVDSAKVADAIVAELGGGSVR